MLFLTYEKTKYELLREFLVSNSLIEEKSPIDTYNNALIYRGKELGFRKLEEYCCYVLNLPFRSFLSEIKALVLSYQPLIIYQNKLQLDSLSLSFVEELMQDPEKKEKPKHTSGWLQNILTTKIEIKSAQQTSCLKVLGVESCGGEEVYAAAIRLKSISPENLQLNILALESDGAFIDKAREGVFHRGKIINLSDNYRTLNFEKTADGRFKISPEVRDLIHFRKFDILTMGISEEDAGKYTLIFCNNLPRFYPKPIAFKILEKTIPYLAPNGLLFISFPDISNYPSFKYLDILGLGKTFIYRRNKNDYTGNPSCVISEKDDSMENRLFHCKACFQDGRLDESMKRVDDILKEHIDSLPANHFKGDIYVRQEKPDKAVFQYSKTLLINPMFLPARYNMAVLNLVRGDIKSAAEEIDKVIGNLDNFDASVLKPMFNLGSGAFAKQCRHLKKLIDEGAEISMEALEASLERDADASGLLSDVEIPDFFEEKARMKDNIEKSEAPKKEEPPAVLDGPRVVVNISELPSTRDYGEHDPWKKKLEREALEKAAARKTEETVAEPQVIPETEAVLPESQEPPKPVKEQVLPFDGPPSVVILKPKQTEVAKETVEMKTGALSKYSVNAQINIPSKDEEFEKKREEARRRVEEQKRRWQEEQQLKQQDKERWSEQARMKARQNRSWMEEAQRRALEAQKKAQEGLTAGPVRIDEESSVKSADFHYLPSLNQFQKEKPAPAESQSPTLFVRPSRTPSIPEHTEETEEEEEKKKEESSKTRKMLDTGNLVSAPIEELKHVTDGTRTFDRLFPKIFLDSLEELLISEDSRGIIELVRSYSDHVSGSQKQVMRTLNRICDVFEKEQSVRKSSGRISASGQVKEVQEDLKKLKSLLHDKNLLEASILFHKILKFKPLLDSLPEFQKNRLKRIKSVLEVKNKRYDEFIDHFFSDPVNQFQEEMWEALSQLTPPSALEETGKKYGLDPKRKPRSI